MTGIIELKVAKYRFSFFSAQDEVNLVAPDSYIVEWRYILMQRSEEKHLLLFAEVTGIEADMPMP